MRAIDFTNSQFPVDTPALDALVLRDQASVVFKGQNVSLPMNSLLALTIAAVSLGQIENAEIVVWFSVILLINATRYAIGQRFRLGLARDENIDARPYLRTCSLGACLSALTWAQILSHDLEIGNPRSTIVIVVLCGISAGSVMQNGAHALSSLSFVVPLLSILVCKIMSNFDTNNIILGFDVIYYLTFSAISVTMTQKTFRETSLLKHQAAGLAISLQGQHEVSIEANRRLQKLANNDPLTNLSNRAAFSAALDRWCQRALETKTALTVLLVDLDNFKSINDTLGHRAGDDVLKEVAERLSAAVAGERVVARLGGDEFAILMTSASDADDRLIADALIDAVSGPLLVNDRIVNIGLSVGVATFPLDCGNPDEVLAAADLALYAAKNGGRHRACRFDQGLRAAAEIARDLENDLPDALSDGSVVVWYQPQVSMGQRKLVGLEALIRWNHPRHGMVQPPLIVAAASRARISSALTGLVLAEASAQIRRLTEAGYEDVNVAVNISPRELGQYDLLGLVDRVIGREALDTRRLELEITEEAMISSEAVATLNLLSNMGVRLAIDDFGTGCSSIAYFRNLKVDRIKIDRCFVTGLAERDADRKLVRTIVGIGRSLGVEVIAEGVETEEDAKLVANLGCDRAQGYHFGRAMSVEALQTWMLAAYRAVPQAPSATWDTLALTG